MICGCTRNMVALFRLNGPLNYPGKEWRFYEKPYESKLKIRVALEALHGELDRRRDRGEIPGSSQSGSTVKKEIHGRSVRGIPVPGGGARTPILRDERNQRVCQFIATPLQSAISYEFCSFRRIHSAHQDRKPDEVYFGTCNPQAMGNGNSKTFTPIFQ